MTKTDIRKACENFLLDWNRRDWMADHGEWADESDHIEEGTLDPDCIEHDADPLEVGSSWQGWDCKEGWSAYQVGEALYLNWWRSPYGGTNRHQRDLWVCVDETFFQCDESEAE